MPQASRGSVVIYPGRTRAAEHEWVTYFELGRRIARLQEMDFLGEYDPAAHNQRRLYFIPVDTLIGVQNARDLGISTEQDLFGGVVPEPFIATKSITHGLVGPDARAIPGWSADFSRRVSDSVLAGFTAFGLDDAQRAGTQLLERGPVRIKPVRSNAGRDQSVVTSPAALTQVLSAMDEEEVASYGLVLEEHLEQVRTHSVGQVRVAGLVASYYGTQHLTEDNEGAMIYGGTDLVVARGGFDALLNLDLSEEIRLAVRQTRTYDAAASDCFPGFLASRRNYDIVYGLDARGQPRSGVLEQSWRVGGASSAEVVALEALHSDAALQVIRASSLELYGRDRTPPAEATILFSGEDPSAGPITKCVVVEAYDHA